MTRAELQRQRESRRDKEPELLMLPIRSLCWVLKGKCDLSDRSPLWVGLPYQFKTETSGIFSWKIKTFDILSRRKTRSSSGPHMVTLSVAQTTVNERAQRLT